MKNNYRLSTIEAIAIIIIIMMNKLILNVPYYIVEVTGTGSIINIFYVGIIDFIILLIIIKLFNKFNNADILDVSEFWTGKKLKTVIGLLAIALFLLVAFVTLINFSNVLHTIYFSNFDMMYILLIFIIGILVANLVGFKSIARTICFAVPFSIFSVLVSFFAVCDSFDLEHLTPILGKSYYNTFIFGLSNGFAMYVIVY